MMWPMMPSSGVYTDTAYRHRLTDRDPVLRTAVCSICGPVRMSRNGKSWMCSNKKADLRASWYNRNPRRAKPSEHALTSKDTQNRLGICPVCGPVEIVPYARGWACANRAAELGHSQAEPHPKCSVCGNYHSRHNPVSPTSGQCEACARLLYQGTEPRGPSDEAAMAQAFGPAHAAHDGTSLGAHMVTNFEWMNPEYIPDYESAVPGWKTIGDKNE